VRNLKSFLSDQGGATAIEYGLIAALLSVTLVSTLAGAGTKLSNKFGAVANGLN
jgi:pilus assembly protein Flp/PilA